MANKGHDGGQLAIFFLVKKTKAVMNSDVGGGCTAASQSFFFCPQDLHNIKSLEARHSLAAFFLYIVYILSYRI